MWRASGVLPCCNTPGRTVSRRERYATHGAETVTSSPKAHAAKIDELAQPRSVSVGRPRRGSGTAPAFGSSEVLTRSDFNVGVVRSKSTSRPRPSTVINPPPHPYLHPQPQPAGRFIVGSLLPGSETSSVVTTNSRRSDVFPWVKGRIQQATDEHVRRSRMMNAKPHQPRVVVGEESGSFGTELDAGGASCTSFWLHV